MRHDEAHGDRGGQLPCDRGPVPAGGEGRPGRHGRRLAGHRPAARTAGRGQGADASTTRSPTDEARLQRDRTLREARAVAQLSHPHIIVVHDVVEDDERPYIVMELIDGGSLADRISAHGPVDADEAARIGIALLGALRRGARGRGAAPGHQAGERAARGRHRPGRPHRLRHRPGRGRHHAHRDRLVRRLARVHRARADVRGAAPAPESDLWSLGALLCTALSGESPFRRDSLGGILHAVVIDEIRPPAQAAPLLPVVRGLLERDPERRLDAAEAERMLRAFRATGRYAEADGRAHSGPAADPAPSGERNPAAGRRRRRRFGVRPRPVRLPWARRTGRRGPRGGACSSARCWSRRWPGRGCRRRRC